MDMNKFISLFISTIILMVLIRIASYEFEYLHDGGFLIFGIVLFIFALSLTAIYENLPIGTRVIASIIIGIISVFIPYKIMYLFSSDKVNPDIIKLVFFISYFSIIGLSWKFMDKYLKKV